MMRILILVFLVTVLPASTAGQNASATSTEKRSKLPKVPSTVEEAVLILKVKWLSKEDRDWILRNPKDHVISRLYRGFGTGVRNKFGLWRGNQKLRDSCGENHPEACSVVILEALWQSIRADADPALIERLECQSQLARAIQIDGSEFYKMSLGELHAALQTQIDLEVARLAAAEPLCQDSLKLDIRGQPTLHCFADTRSTKAGLPNWKLVPLEGLLEGIGFGTFFASSHTPPTLTLVYSRKCQFSTPPYLYGVKDKNTPSDKP